METITNCTQCPKQCPLNALKCGKGRACAESQADGIAPDAATEVNTGHTYRHGKREFSGAEKHMHEHGKRGGHRHGGDSFADRDNLEGLIRACGHMLHHGAGRPGGQERILHILSCRKDISQKELQEILRIQPGSISEILSKLESKDLIERIKDDEDKRKTIVKITDAGKAYMHMCSKSQKEQDLFSSLDEKQQETLKILLKMLLEDWEKKNEEETE